MEYKKYNKNKSKEVKIFDDKRLFSYGIWLLSKKDYSHHEIFQKMKKYQPEEEIIQTVIKKLIDYGYISEERLAGNTIRAYTKKESINKTKMRLLNKGIPKEVVEKSIEEEFEIDKEIDNGLLLIEKKFKQFNPEVKQKYYSFLAGKGYDYPTISKIINIFKERKEED